MTPNRDARIYSPWLQIAFLFGAFIILLILLLPPQRTMIILPENVRQLREIARFETNPNYAVQQIELNHAGDTLIATANYFNYVWQLKEGIQQTVDLSESGGVTTQFSLWNDRPTATFLNWTGTLRLLDMATGDIVRSFDGLNASNDKIWTFNHDGSLMAISNVSMLSVLDIATQENRFTVEAEVGRSFDSSYLAFSDDSNLLAAIYRRPSCECDPDLTVWDIESGQQRNLLGTFNGGFAQTFTFSDDNQLLAVGGFIYTDPGFDALIQLWDLETGTELVSRQFDGNAIDKILVSPDKRLIAASGMTSLWLWKTDDLIAGEPPLVEEIGGDAMGYFNGIAFSPDYQLFAYGTPNGKIRLVNTSTGALVTELQGHAGKINDLTFSADGRLLVSAGRDSTIRIWALDEQGIMKSPSLGISIPAPIMAPTVPGGVR